MEFSSGPIAGLSSDGSALMYSQSSITTYAGQSGSPVWRYNPSNGSRVIYGVVAGGYASNGMNFAMRITQSIFNSLQSWRSADRAPGVSSLAANQLQTAPPAHPVGIVALSPNPAVSTVITPAKAATSPAQVATPRPDPSPVVAMPLDSLEARRHHDLFDSALESFLSA
jgi:hypothetical protein